MDDLKQYAESSSIVGLNNIFTSKTTLGKVFWFLVVALSFIIPIYLITVNVSDWNNNPVSTLVKTLPISRAKFPPVTVCPPKHSHTGLNYDLVRGDNITLGENDREELMAKAVDELFKEDFKIVKILKSFEEREGPRNWYEGNTEVSVPADTSYVIDGNHFTGNSYTFVTSATSGSVGTPGFGKPLDWELLRITAPNYFFTIILNKPLQDKDSHKSIFIVLKLKIEPWSYVESVTLNTGVTKKLNDTFFFGKTQLLTEPIKYDLREGLKN